MMLGWFSRSEAENYGFDVYAKSNGEYAVVTDLCEHTEPMPEGAKFVGEIDLDQRLIGSNENNRRNLEKLDPIKLRFAFEDINATEILDGILKRE